MTNRDKELAVLLEKINDIRRTAPLVNDAMGSVVKPYVYEGDDFDINAGKFRDPYPEERFAEAELRAWFFGEYLPLMEELDDYDWADAPGWGGGDDCTRI